MMKVAKYLALSALFLIPFLPLYIAGSMYFPFITGKGFLFRILVEVAAFSYLALAIADTRYRPRFSWVLVLYGTLVTWMFVADLFALNAHKAFWSNYERMDGWITLVHMFLFFLVAGSILTVEKLWKRWWGTFIATSALVVGYSLLQLSGSVTIHQGGVRVDATLGNAAYLAAYLLFALAVTVWQAFESKGWLRYSLAALAALQLIVLFYTATRGAILGVVGGAVLASFLWLLTADGKRRKIAIGLFAGLLVLISGFFLVRNTEWVKNDPTLGRIASITLAEGATRFTLWNMAFEGVMERPVTGYGHEGFNYIFNEKYRPSLFAQEPWFDRAHNVFIDWLVWGGIPAFLLFVGLFVVALYALYRSKASRTERIVLTSALAAYAFQALFVFDNLFSYVPLAAILAMIHAESSRPWKKLQVLPEAKRADVNTVVAPLCLVVGLVVVWVVNVPGMSGGGHLVYAISPHGNPQVNLDYFKSALSDGTFATQEVREQLVSYTGTVVGDPKADNALKSAFAQLAIEEMGKEIERVPGDARLYMQLALAYRIVGDYDAALLAIDKAISLSPKKQGFLLEKGNTLFAAGRREEARDALYAAYELSPEFPTLAGYAAAGDILTGNTARAHALLLASFGTTTVDNMALMQAYLETRQYDELIKILDLQAKAQGGAPTAVIRLASGYAVAGRYEEARAILRKLVQEHPEVAGEVQSLIASFPVGR